jgi:hypothetical protein
MREERRSCSVFEARDAERLASSDDRKMWRLLLARLHPDAGGDHDLFAFVCAIRDEMSSGDRAARTTVSGGNARSRQCASAPFLRTWREAMGHWSTSNHDILKTFRTR